MIAKNRFRTCFNEFDDLVRVISGGKVVEALVNDRQEQSLVRMGPGQSARRD